MKLKTLKPGERDRSRAAQKRRIEVLIRDCYTCRICGIHRAEEVDHIIPLHRGGSDDESNMQAICTDCHKKKTNADMGWAPTCDIGEDGLPLDDNHWWNR